MPLHKFKEAELRQYCKEYIESLELWLRRIIDSSLSKNYGLNYFEYKDGNGVNLISNAIKKEVAQRIQEEPDRYPRPIDACLLETEIKIITNPDLYKKHFADVFSTAFPEGVDELRTFLTRLIDPRNKLYHANPISVREAERIICYSNDIIDAIKAYYQQNNMNQEFNVPLIVKYSDSFGNVLYRDQFTGQTLIGGQYIDFRNSSDMTLRPGDIISIEVEIDSSFPKDSYYLQWRNLIEEQTGDNKSTYTIQMKDIGQEFNLSCKVTSKKEWHRLNGYDDYLVIKFKVLPPL